jgi:sulfonate transport system permease protein
MGNGRRDALGRAADRPLEADGVSVQALVRRHVDLRPLAVPAAGVALWAALDASGVANARILVPPWHLLTGAHDLITSGDAWTSVGASVGRVLAGGTAGATLGVAVGLAIGESRRAESIVAPSVNALRQVALFAWIPLLTAWFGSDEFPKLVLIALAAFFPTVLNTAIGCRQVPLALREVGRVLEFDAAARLRRIVLPGALPAIAAGLRIAFTSAWIGTIGAEYLIDQGPGLGVLLASARLDDRMDLVLLLMLTLALIGLALDRLLQRLVPARLARLATEVVDD